MLSATAAHEAASAPAPAMRPQPKPKVPTQAKMLPTPAMAAPIPHVPVAADLLVSQSPKIGGTKHERTVNQTRRFMMIDEIIFSERNKIFSWLEAVCK